VKKLSESRLRLISIEIANTSKIKTSTAMLNLTIMNELPLNKKIARLDVANLRPQNKFGKNSNNFETLKITKIKRINAKA
jgi:hypothetical protein